MPQQAWQPLLLSKLNLSHMQFCLPPPLPSWFRAAHGPTVRPQLGSHTPQPWEATQMWQEGNLPGGCSQNSSCDV